MGDPYFLALSEVVGAVRNIVADKHLQHEISVPVLDIENKSPSISTAISSYGNRPKGEVVLNFCGDWPAIHFDENGTQSRIETFYLREGELIETVKNSRVSSDEIAMRIVTFLLEVQRRNDA